MRTTKVSNVSATLPCIRAPRHVCSPAAFIESGNMLIMTLAHARATGDGSLIGLYVRLHIPSSADVRMVLTLIPIEVHASQEMGGLPHRQLHASHGRTVRRIRKTERRCVADEQRSA